MQRTARNYAARSSRPAARGDVMPKVQAHQRRLRHVHSTLNKSPPHLIPALAGTASGGAPGHRVVRVEVRTVAPEVARFRWDDSLPAFYCTNTVVKVITDTGYEGVGGVSNYTNYDFDRYTAECTRHIIPILLGKDPLMREELHELCSSRVWPYPVRVRCA
eukprot:COSAG02_NODE_1704_length_11240_cov_9.848308_4_plen_161_part_00